MGEPIAIIDCLSASYGGSKVLTDISFSLTEDDCLAIVGPVGSGKTTLAKALSGRLFRTGSVYFKSRTNRVHPSILLVEQQHHFKNRSNMRISICSSVLILLIRGMRIRFGRNCRMKMKN